MTITELREKRARLWNTMEGFLDKHRNDMGVLKAEDDATYSNMEGELDSLTNEIHRMERREVHEKELNKAVNTPIVTTPVDNKPERTGRASDESERIFRIIFVAEHRFTMYSLRVQTLTVVFLFPRNLKQALFRRLRRRTLSVHLQR